MVVSLRAEVEDDCWPVGSYLAALEGLVQRATCLKMTQAKGQSRSAFLDRVVAACADAEMDKLTPDQLIVHIVLAGSSDQETKEKLHELENPSIKELRRAAKRLDVIKVGQTKPSSTTGVSPTSGSTTGVSPTSSVGKISGSFEGRGAMVSRFRRRTRYGSYPY